MIMSKKIEENREMLMLYKTRTTGKYVKDFRCPRYQTLYRFH